MDGNYYASYSCVLEAGVHSDPLIQESHHVKSLKVEDPRMR